MENFTLSTKLAAYLLVSIFLVFDMPCYNCHNPLTKYSSSHASTAADGLQLHRLTPYLLDHILTSLTRSTKARCTPRWVGQLASLRSVVAVVALRLHPSDRNSYLLAQASSFKLTFGERFADSTLNLTLVL